MIQASVSSCEVTGTSTDITATASAFVPVKWYNCSDFAKYMSLTCTLKVIWYIRKGNNVGHCYQFVVNDWKQSKNDSKDQETIQSSTSSDP